MSVLDADLFCMEDLLKYKKWRYFINLTGQEFPLKTNADLVEILTAFNGANSIDFDGLMKDKKPWRTRNYYKPGYRLTELRKDPLPEGLTQSNLVKGSKLIAASRGFSEFMLTDPVALAFRKWLNHSWISDETFAPTLNYNPQLGGVLQKHGFRDLCHCHMKRSTRVVITPSVMQYTFSPIVGTKWLDQQFLAPDIVKMSLLG